MVLSSRDFDEMLSQHPITLTKDCEDLSFVKVIGDGRKFKCFVTSMSFVIFNWIE
jgi:hypothetical protein